MLIQLGLNIGSIVGFDRDVDGDTLTALVEEAVQRHINADAIKDIIEQELDTTVLQLNVGAKIESISPEEVAMKQMAAEAMAKLKENPEIAEMIKAATGVDLRIHTQDNLHRDSEEDDYDHIVVPFPTRPGRH